MTNKQRELILDLIRELDYEDEQVDGIAEQLDLGKLGDRWPDLDTDDASSLITELIELKRDKELRDRGDKP